jgi:quinol monooxygenase YgiN
MATVVRFAGSEIRVRVTPGRKTHLIVSNWRKLMDRFALLALLEAKPGKETEVEEFLKSAQPMAAQEAGTTTWYAVKLGPTRFGIFDTFKDEAGRDAHLSGEIAKALMANAGELLAKAPQIEKLEILASKASGA